MSTEAKNKLLTEFSSKRRADNQIEEEKRGNVSVNHDGIDTGALLTGDSSEELRMQDTL